MAIVLPFDGSVVLVEEILGGHQQGLLVAGVEHARRWERQPGVR